MTAGLFLLIALAGGVGAVGRLIVDGVVRSKVSGTLPWGTILINLSGSLLLGFIVGLTAAGVLPEWAHLVVGTGFLGGYTTFSTASFETVRLMQERRWVGGLLNALGTLVGATACAGLGLWIGMGL